MDKINMSADELRLCFEPIWGRTWQDKLAKATGYSIRSIGRFAHSAEPMPDHITIFFLVVIHNLDPWNNCEHYRMPDRLFAFYLVMMEFHKKLMNVQNND